MFILSLGASVCPFSIGHSMIQHRVPCKTWVTSRPREVVVNSVTLLMEPFTYFCWVCIHSPKLSTEQAETLDLSQHFWQMQYNSWNTRLFTYFQSCILIYIIFHLRSHTFRSPFVLVNMDFKMYLQRSKTQRLKKGCY